LVLFTYICINKGDKETILIGIFLFVSKKCKNISERERKKEKSEKERLRKDIKERGK
jgi:hypothetical protein